MNYFHHTPQAAGNKPEKFNLTELSLLYNLLSELPESMGNLTNLTLTSDTQLSKLPKSLGNLTKGFDKDDDEDDELTEIEVSDGGAFSGEVVIGSITDEQLFNLMNESFKRPISINSLEEIEGWNEWSEMDDVFHHICVSLAGVDDDLFSEYEDELFQVEKGSLYMIICRRETGVFKLNDDDSSLPKVVHLIAGHDFCSSVTIDDKTYGFDDEDADWTGFSFFIGQGNDNGELKFVYDTILQGYGEDEETLCDLSEGILT